MSILYEKYRPNNLENYIGNKKLVEILSNWCNSFYNKSFQTKQNKPNILLIGDPGIGKTTLAYSLLNSYNLKFIILYLSFICVSFGDCQLLICSKCCFPSNSIIILCSGIQKSNGNNRLFLHHSTLNCFLNVEYIGFNILYNLDSV